MKTIEITEEQAKQMYKSGIESLKSIVESNFPNLFHEEKKWEDIKEMLKEIFKLINNNYDSEPELMKELGFDDKLFVKIEQLINSATNF